MKTIGSISGDVMEIVRKKATMTLDEIYEQDRSDIDVKEFIKKYDIEPETYYNGRGVIHEFVRAKDSDPVMYPRLRLIEGHIQIEYAYRSQRLQEFYTRRPKSFYDKSVEHLKGITLDDIKIEVTNSQAVGYITDFLTIYKGNPRQKGMWLVGSMGIGKTYLLGALAGELKKENIAFEFIGMDQFLHDLKGMMKAKDSNLEKRKNELKEATSVLLIDDIGLERPSYWNNEVLKGILQYRYDNKLPTFFTSNLTMADYCKQLLSADDLNRADVERFYNKMLMPLSVEVSMGGRNRRKDT